MSNVKRRLAPLFNSKENMCTNRQSFFVTLSPKTSNSKILHDRDENSSMRSFPYTTAKSVAQPCTSSATQKDLPQPSSRNSGAQSSIPNHLLHDRRPKRPLDEDELGVKSAKIPERSRFFPIFDSKKESRSATVARKVLPVEPRHSTPGAVLSHTPIAVRRTPNSGLNLKIENQDDCNQMQSPPKKTYSKMDKSSVASLKYQHLKRLSPRRRIVPSRKSVEYRPIYGNNMGEAATSHRANDVVAPEKCRQIEPECYLVSSDESEDMEEDGESDRIDSDLGIIFSEDNDPRHAVNNGSPQRLSHDLNYSPVEYSVETQNIPAKGVELNDELEWEEEEFEDEESGVVESLEVEYGEEESYEEESCEEEYEKDDTAEEDVDVEDEEEEEETEYFGEYECEEAAYFYSGNTGVNVEKFGTKILECHIIHVGSYNVIPCEDTESKVKLHLESNQLWFKAPIVGSGNSDYNDSNSSCVIIKPQDIESIVSHLSVNVCVLFIFTNDSCAVRIRKQLNLSKDGCGYFEPKSPDDGERVITVLFSKLSRSSLNYLQYIFPSFKFMKEAPLHVANYFIKKTIPEVFQEVVKSNVKPGGTEPVRMELVETASDSTELVVTGSDKTELVETGSDRTERVVTGSDKMELVETGLSETEQGGIKQMTFSPIKDVEDLPEVDIIYPPPPQPGGISIKIDDYLRLDDDEYLNDNIIDFYLCYLKNEKISKQDQQRTHIFSSHFYQRLTNKSQSRSVLIKSFVSHQNVKNWTKNVDIFSKDFIIIPIIRDKHWFLVIICFPGLMPKFLSKQSEEEESEEEEGDALNDSSLKCSTRRLSVSDDDRKLSGDTPASKKVSCPSPDSSTHPNVLLTCPDDTSTPTDDGSTQPDEVVQYHQMPCILVLDSFPVSKQSSVIKALKAYLNCEWKAKKESICDFSNMASLNLDVPRQTNSSDCGIYVLQYVESFFENPLPYFSLVMPELKDWFPLETVRYKRRYIKDLIVELNNQDKSNV